jgi:uncharacterized membrane protein YebE (DUF533 family)
MLMKELELLRAACCVAGADGSVSDREREVIQRMATRVGVGAASLRAMLDMATHDERFRADQLELIHHEPERAFEMLYKMARLEAEVPEAERDLLTRFGRKLGLSVESMNEVIRRAHGA